MEKGLVNEGHHLVQGVRVVMVNNQKNMEYTIGGDADFNQAFVKKVEADP